MPNGPHLNSPDPFVQVATTTGQPLLYPLMLDAIGDAICMFDARAELTWQNKACMTLSGSETVEHLPPTSLTDFLTRHQLDDFRKNLFKALAGERMFYEWTCYGTTKNFLIELRPLRDDKQVIGVMGTVRENGNFGIDSGNGSSAGNNQVTERLTDAFIALDKDWKYTYLNSKAEELHGYSASELIGKIIWDVFPDVLTEPFFQHLQKAMETQQPLRVELYYSTRNKWFEDFIYPSSDGVSVYYRDITAQKLAEKQLIRSEQQYRSLVEQAADAIIIADLRGRCLDINTMAEKMTGYSRNELAGLNIFSLLVIGSGEPPIRIAELLNQQSILQERRVRRKDGSVFHAELNSKLLTGDRILVIGRDISSRKKMELELQESEFRYRTLFEEGADGVCFYDIEKDRYVGVNKRMTELFGYSREEFLQMNITGIAFQDDIFQQPPCYLGLAMGITVTNERYFRHKSGKGIWVETTTRCMGGSNYVSFMRDINDRKKAEAALQASISEISDYKYAIDQATTVSFSDPAGNITHVNDNFVRLYGYTREEIIGVNHKILNSGMHDSEFWKKFWTSIKAGKVLKAEVCNKAKDGSLQWADTTIVPFLDAKGKPTQFLAIRNDITEKRKLELELKERERDEQIRIAETALDAQEKERNFLGQELHDNVNQILVGTKLILSVVAEDPVKYKEVLENSIQNIQRAIEENRKLSHSLATPDMKQISLPKQLASLAHNMFYQQPVKVAFSRRGLPDEGVDDKRKITIYRIAQEQCTNIIKYARATRVDISLRIKENDLQLVIKDNGVGMEPGKSTNGIGIRNMRGRVSIYGGSLSIETAPGEGFKLTVTIPR